MPATRKARPASAGAAFTPRRGRPTADQAAAIANAILAAATEIFLSADYEGASMEAIAARAGVPKSTLYKRFPDKRTLLRAVLKERVATWAPPERDAHLSDDIEQRLKQHAVWMLTQATSSEVRAFLGLVASAWKDPAEAPSRRDVIGYTDMANRLAEEIRAFGPKRGIHAKDPERVALALMAMLAGWAGMSGAGPELSDAEAMTFAHTAVDLLLNGSAAW
ncbi:TetR/AcrR family transcriptional regulator [Phenylobacterium sp. LjRoot225]|uniref:TetR/AcrR family transcriptional regulator n=1 Tax=Phenylobacterium sp. LjRoot225 TaxID=3342285 RepID=UPI003ECEC851